MLTGVRRAARDGRPACGCTRRRTAASCCRRASGGSASRKRSGQLGRAEGDRLHGRTSLRAGEPERLWSCAACGARSSIRSRRCSPLRAPASSPDGRPGDGRHVRAHVPHLAVGAARARSVERAVVRRPPRGRLLAAVPAAGRARRPARGRRRSPASRPCGVFGWLVARRRAHARRGRGGHLAVRERDHRPTSSSGGCRSRSASPARSARGRARCARGRRRAARRERPAAARAGGALGVTAGGGQWGPLRMLMGSSLARPATVGVPDAAAPALAVPASRARVGWALGAGALAFAATWASPVAGLFLCTAALGPAIAGGRTGRLRAALLVGPACAGRAGDRRRVPGGRRRTASSATAFWPMLALCVWSTLMLAERPRAVRVAAVVYLAAARRRVRAPHAARPERAAARRAARPVAARALPAPARAARAAGPGDRAARLPPVAAGRARGDRGVGRPGDQAGLLRAAPRAARRRCARPGDRVEVPLTRNHWEAAYVAPAHPAGPRLAPPARPRGQRPLLRRPAGSTRPTYLAWLHAEAVRWVALPARGARRLGRARGARSCAPACRA